MPEPELADLGALGRPIIFVVDDEVERLSLKELLRSKEYIKSRYTLETADNVETALQRIREFDGDGQEIALFLVDQWMYEDQLAGTTLLARARKFFPRAIRVLLTAHQDSSVAIDAINKGLLDYYMLKGSAITAEGSTTKARPTLTDEFDREIPRMLDQWESRRMRRFRGVRVVGRRNDPEDKDGSGQRRLQEMQQALARRLLTYEYLDCDENEQAKELAQHHVENGGRLPIVSIPPKERNTAPLKLEALAQLEKAIAQLDIKPTDLYDLIIIGGGPAGLSAAVFAGSEGLKTCLIETSHSTGGSASESARVENYLGFPLGIRGRDLMNEAAAQALSFGVDILYPLEAKELCLEAKACPETGNHHKYVKLKHLGDNDWDGKVTGRAVLLAPGVNFTRLEKAHPGSNLESFVNKGLGIYYGGVVARAAQLRDRHVVVVGGGNSAVQAALHLSKFAHEVTIVVRSPTGLADNTSQYLIDEVNGKGTKIKKITGAEVVNAFDSQGGATGTLHHLALKGSDHTPLECDAVFLFIGNSPNTGFLKGAVALDDRGHILTGQDLEWYDKVAYAPLRRDPFWLETNIPGVFAAGDARRSRANQRIASAVGEGSVAVGLIHLYLGPVPQRTSRG
jgi:thioredoxin reductase (NADPH)